jgi:hypothetical protein
MFYGKLGFRPEDVGLSYVATLGRGLEGAAWSLLGLWLLIAVNERCEPFEWTKEADELSDKATRKTRKKTSLTRH